MPKRNPLLATMLATLAIAVELYLFSPAILGMNGSPVVQVLAFFLLVLVSWFGWLFILTMLRLK